MRQIEQITQKGRKRKNYQQGKSNDMLQRCEGGKRHLTSMKLGNTQMTVPGRSCRSVAKCVIRLKFSFIIASGVVARLCAIDASVSPS
jgi:hypothetical protein